MASAFKSAAEELHDLSYVHAGLFLLGLALTVAPQSALKPVGFCADKLYTDYLLVHRFTFFFALATFGAALITGHVKRRVPDGGLQGVAIARARVLLRLHAALGCVLSAAASGMAVAAYTHLLQVKTGRWQCLPTEVRSGILATYAVVTYVAGVVYFHVGRSIVMLD